MKIRIRYAARGIDGEFAFRQTRYNYRVQPIHGRFGCINFHRSHDCWFLQDCALKQNPVITPTTAPPKIKRAGCCSALHYNVLPSHAATTKAYSCARST